MTVKEASDVVVRISNDKNFPESVREEYKNRKECYWENNFPVDQRIIPEEEYLDDLLEDLEDAGYKLVTFSNDPEYANRIYVKGRTTYSSFEELKGSGEYYVDLDNVFINGYGDYVNIDGFMYPDDFDIHNAFLDQDQEWTYVLETYFYGKNMVSLYDLPYLRPEMLERFVDLKDYGRELTYKRKFAATNVKFEYPDDSGFREGDYKDSDFKSGCSDIVYSDFIPYREEFDNGDYQAVDSLPEGLLDDLIAITYTRNSKAGQDSGVRFLFHFFLHSSGGMCRDECIYGDRGTKSSYEDGYFSFLANEQANPGVFSEDVEYYKNKLKSWVAVESFIKKTGCELYLIGVSDSVSHPRVFKIRGNHLVIFYTLVN